MSAMTMPLSSSSSLNPDAPLFIPAVFRQVEDFSPEWWELVKTTAWFRDHWFREHQEQEEYLAEEGEGAGDVADLLPDSFDLLEFESDDLFYHQPLDVDLKKQPGFGSDADAVLKTLSSPKSGAARAFREQPKYGEKPVQHVSPKNSIRRAIHQPR